MSDVKEDKPGEYLIGLALGTAVAAAAWFLYKTKKGKHLHSWWNKYFSQIQDEWAKLQEQGQVVKPQTAPKPRRVKVKKKLFLKSGQRLGK